MERIGFRKTADYLEANCEDIAYRWMGLVESAAGEYLQPIRQVVEERAQANVLLLVEALRAWKAADRQRLHEQIYEVGREVAKQGLEGGVPLAEILRAWSVFRLAVLDGVQRMLLHRLWLVFPPHVLKVEDQINLAIDRQMLAISQAYLRARDEVIAQKRQDLQETNEQLILLYELATSITSSLDLAQALDSIAWTVTELLKLPMSIIALFQEETNSFIALPYGHRGLDAEFIERFHMPACDGIGGRVLRTGGVYVASKLETDELFRHPASIATPARSLMCAPLRAQEKHLGVIYALDVLPRQFSETEVNLFTALANQAAIVVENARLYDEARCKAEALSAVVQEMNHRIKNNLQTVADFLSLQMYQRHDKSYEECLRESIGRVKSIATVHEFLSMEDTKVTDIREIAQRVMDMALQDRQGTLGKRITTSVVGNSILVPSKQATALALVLNELLANALRHAFVGRQEGRLEVEIEEQAPQVVVSVRDDGVGYAPESGKSSNGLGLQIVRTLVEKDLGGMLDFSRNGGTTVRVLFYK